MQGFWGLARFADRPALVEDGRITTYGELDEAARAVSAELGARSLVFLEARNTARSIAAYLGCLIGGHPVFLFNPQDRDRAEALIPRFRPNALIDSEDVHRLESAALDLHPDLAVLLGTSGSTGSPKLVKLSKGAVQSNAAAIAQYLELRTDDRAVTSLKPAHSFGMSVINSHLAVGASLLLTDLSITDAGFWPQVEKGGATSLSGVPYSYEMLRRAPEAWAKIPSLRHLAQAGGKLAPDLVRHFAELGERSGWRFFVMYGQTEAAPRIAYLPPDLAPAHPDSIGRPIPGGELSVLDENGQPLADGVAGELCYRGPNIMMGYAEDASALAVDETPPFLLTGDIARKDADGLIRIVGRRARFVKPFGVRINLDDVQDAARIRAPGAVSAGDGETILICAPRAEAGALAAIVAELASRYGLPAFALETVAVDEIPLLSNGKPDYAAIARLRAAPRPRSFLSNILSPDYFKAVFAEVGKILGLRPDVFASVAGLYAALLNRPQVSGSDTFVGLAGDSLSYVQVHLALESLLGRTPDGWEQMSVDELESLRANVAPV